MLNTTAEIILELRDRFSDGARRVAKSAKEMEKNVDKAGDAVEETEEKARDAGDGGFNRLADSFKKVAIAVGTAYATIKSFQILFDLVARGETFQIVSDQFKRLGGDIDALRDAVQGMVDDRTLMQLYNRALSTGKMTAEQFRKLMVVVHQWAVSTGDDFKQYMESITDAIAGGTAGALEDVVGQVDNLDEAWRRVDERYKELSNTQKKSIIHTQSAVSAWNSFVDAFSKWLAKSPFIKQTLEALTDVFRHLVRQIDEANEKVAIWDSTIGMKDRLLKGIDTQIKKYENLIEVQNQAIKHGLYDAKKVAEYNKEIERLNELKGQLVKASYILRMRMEDAIKAGEDFATFYKNLPQWIKDTLEQAGVDTILYVQDTFEKLRELLKRPAEEAGKQAGKSFKMGFKQAVKKEKDEEKTLEEVIGDYLKGMSKFSQGMLLGKAEVGFYSLKETSDKVKDAFIGNLHEMSGEVITFDEIVIEATADVIDGWENFLIRFRQLAQSVLVNQVANLWTQFWESMVTQDWDSMLVGFLNSLATMSAQLGSFLVLAGTGLTFIPGFQASSEAVVAGAGLLALAGVLRGLASIAGSHGGGTAFGAPNTSTGGWAGVPPSEHEGGGKTIIINIDSGMGLDTAETIARKVKEAMDYAEAMGY